MKVLVTPPAFPTAFNQAYSWVASIEGGWSNHPNDSGGLTRWGVTQALAATYGIDLRALTPLQAKAIFFQEFWSPLLLSTLASRSSWLACEVFEFAVHAGPRVSVKTLQSVLNLLLSDTPQTPPLKVDGALGPVTIQACFSYLSKPPKKISEVALINAFNGEQYAFYKDLVSRREKDLAFLRGWCAHRLRPIYAIGAEGPTAVITAGAEQ